MAFGLSAWVTGAVFDLWELGEPGDLNPAGKEWLRRNALDCRRLGVLAGGWWVHEGRRQDEGHGRQFIPLTNWHERHATWRETRLKQSRERAQEAAGRGLEPEAAAIDPMVPTHEKAALPQKVWCVQGRRLQPFVIPGGSPAFMGGGLRLTGTCPGCGGLLQTESPGSRMRNFRHDARPASCPQPCHLMSDETATGSTGTGDGGGPSGGGAAGRPACRKSLRWEE